MRSLGFWRRIECDGRCCGRVSKKSDRRGCDQLEGGRREIARIAYMKCCLLGRLPHQVSARAQLSLADKLGELVVTCPKIEGQGRNDLPLVLQIVAVDPPGLASRVRDRERLVARLSTGLVDWQNIRGGAERRALSLDVKAATNRVFGGRPPAPIALHAACPALPVRGLGDAVEQEIARGIPRREVGTAVSGEPGDLEIDIADVLLPGEDAEIVDLALVLVQGDRGKIGDAVYGEPEARSLARDLRDLELTARCTKNGSQSRRRIENPGHITKPLWLLGPVVDSIEGGSRVLDTLLVSQVFAGEVIVDLPDPAAPFGARLEGPGLGLYVDNPGCAQTVLRRKAASDQRHGISEPCLQCLPKNIDPFRQLNSVYAELQVGVIVAHKRS